MPFSIRTRIQKPSALALCALIAGAALTGPLATKARAQDAGALLNILVKKGVLSDQEAEELRVDLAKESAGAVLQTVSGGKSNSGLSLTGRIQVQYANLESTDAGEAGDQPRVSHLFMRRFYIGMKGNIGANFIADFNYDFAGGTFDKAYIRWAGNIGSAPFSFDAGFRKPNFGYEEYTSSGSLKAIERSGITRYFAEDVNGRRLGSASYRVGLFADYNPNAFAGKATGFFAGAALTNPERVATPSGISAVGTNNTNKIATWGNLGYGWQGKLLIGAAAAFLPGQGGINAVAGDGTRGGDLTQGSVYFDLTAGRFNLAGEYLLAKVEQGTGPAKDAAISGFWIQPSLKLNDSWELTGRYSHTATDGRGIRLSDGVRSATSRGGDSTGKILGEYYIGATYHIVATDVKIQFGYVGGRTSGALTPGSSINKETATGFRSQIQVNF